MNEKPLSERLIDVHEVARRLKCHRHTVGRYARNPKLNFPQPRYFFNKALYDAEEIEQWLADNLKTDFIANSHRQRMLAAEKPAEDSAGNGDSAA